MIMCKNKNKAFIKMCITVVIAFIVGFYTPPINISQKTDNTYSPPRYFVSEAIIEKALIDHMTEIILNNANEVHNDVSVKYINAPQDTSFKSFMDYRAITDQTSKQWILQAKAATDENGIRVINDHYCVAMGSGIGIIGQKFLITLDSGEQLPVIMCDQKSDKHTDETHTYKRMTNERANIVEFIVDTDQLNKNALYTGDISAISDKFAGMIISIELEEF